MSHSFRTKARELEEYWKGIAASRLGVPRSELFWDFWPFFSRSGDAKVVLGGTGAQVAAVRGLTLSSGGTSGGLATFHLGGIATQSLPVAAGAANKVWVGGEFSVTTAIGTGAEVGIGLHDYTTGRIGIIGAREATNATNFVAYGNSGTPIDSGVAFAVGQKIHEYWRDGATSFYRILDAATGAQQALVSGDVRVGANCNAVCAATNGDNAVRAGTFRWIGLAVPRGG